MEESRGKRGLYPVQARHTECDELSSCRSTCSMWHSGASFLSDLSGLRCDLGVCWMLP